MARQLHELKALRADLRKPSRDLGLRAAEEIEAQVARELANAVVPVRQAMAAAAGRLGRLDDWVREALLAGLRAQPAGGSAVARQPHPPQGTSGNLVARLRRGLVAVLANRMRSSAAR